MTDTSHVSNEVLEDVAFLARSGNRVQVLERLTETGSEPAPLGYDPRELQEITGASEATLSRILNEFQERDWARRTTEGNYVATPQGEHVAADFEPFIKSMETNRKLGAALGSIPPDELTIDLHHFQDATIRQQKPDEPIGMMYLEAYRETTSFYCLTWFASDPALGMAIENGVLNGRITTYEGITASSANPIRDNHKGPPDMRKIIDAGGRLFVYDGRLPCNIFILDDLVFISSDFRYIIESGNETVRDWALDMVERYRVESREVTVDEFPE